MKKIICLALVAILTVICCACGASSDEEAVVETTEKVVEAPVMQMVINTSAEDTTTSKRTFHQDEGTVIVHYYIESENPEETIRIKVEDQWGADGQTKEDFKVDSDEIKTVETNTWGKHYIHKNGSNLYFYRITFYYGETDVVMNTATIYRPYDKVYYTEDNFSDTAPEYHHIKNLNEEEQSLFDIIKVSIIDYAKINHFESVSNIEVWQGEEAIYLYVSYKTNGKHSMIFFKVDNEDYSKYVAGSNIDIPDGEGTADQQVKFDLYYIVGALNAELAG